MEKHGERYGENPGSGERGEKETGEEEKDHPMTATAVIGSIDRRKSLLGNKARALSPRQGCDACVLWMAVGL